ncbi:hypothetical protein B0F90DRAFT_1756934 [Multifurca ochricompacta]|uniref:Uncharacterized protein n=1 Tax=Multifurca ochricompacta TaxID=376703 RepID=A0AAD4LYD2_9AGAM|nr:hypothetical protein B0F90DRAFT_1756934 [Multifurca ochricompacta]
MGGLQQGFHFATSWRIMGACHTHTSIVLLENELELVIQHIVTPRLPPVYGMRRDDGCIGNSSVLVHAITPRNTRRAKGSSDFLIVAQFLAGWLADSPQPLLGVGVACRDRDTQICRPVLWSNGEYFWGEFIYFGVFLPSAEFILCPPPLPPPQPTRGEVQLKYLNSYTIYCDISVMAE